VGVAHAAAALGWRARGVARSPLPGPSGNVEFFLWLRHDDEPGLSDDRIVELVTGAVDGGGE
jgi:23S rRNA (cytidine1920-2'-O)/16S rRNA (cytidine1409-2'-O)-methyltransferase